MLFRSVAIEVVDIKQICEDAHEELAWRGRQLVAFLQLDPLPRKNAPHVVATEDPAGFDEIWFSALFPSVPAIERARFPDEATLRGEALAAGFASLDVERIVTHRTISRAAAVDLIESRAYSTFDLLPPAEYAAGLARAVRDLPAEIRYASVWLLAVARR